jgi:hypothetical protein
VGRKTVLYADLSESVNTLGPSNSVLIFECAAIRVVLSSKVPTTGAQRTDACLLNEAPLRCCMSQQCIGAYLIFCYILRNIGKKKTVKHRVH